MCQIPNFIPRVYFSWHWCAFLVLGMKKWQILSTAILADFDFTVDHTIYRNGYNIL